MPNDDATPAAVPVRLRAFVERSWLSWQGHPHRWWADPANPGRVIRVFDDSLELQEHLIDWRDARTPEAQSFRRWEAEKRALRQAEENESARLQELPEFVAAKRAMAQDAERERIASHDPWGKIRRQQAAFEAESFRRNAERTYRAAKPWQAGEAWREKKGEG